MKRFIFVLFSIIFIFTFNINAFAQSNLSVTYDEWINYIDDVQNDDNVVSQALRMLGFVASDVKFALKVPAATVKDILNIPSDTTIKDYIKSKTSRSEDDKPVLDTDLHDGLKEVSEYYISEDIAYLWSYTADDLASLFSSVDAYIEAKKLMGSDLLSNEYYFLCSYYGINKLYTVSKTSYPYLFINGSSQTENKTRNFAWGNMINGNNNQTISMDVYNWDATNKEWVSAGTGLITCYGLIDINKQIDHETATNQRAFFLSNTSHIKIRYISGTANVSDILYQPYYYNNDVWHNFTSSSGDYTIDNSNYNSVTYGDITSYIDSFNSDNGYPPSVQEIEKHIKDTDNDDNGGGSDSGGSGSDDDDGVGIFDWLKNLGKVLGDLIKGVGEFITEIIAGLVSALNDLMSSLSGLITDTLGSLTTVFSSIIDFVYSGLPDSVKGIMMLALTVSLLITVIQLIRK